jgi:hypothetical protein
MHMSFRSLAGRCLVVALAVVAPLMGGLQPHATAAAPAGLIAVPPPGHCYGDYCSGRDPHVEHCDDDAYTVATGYIPGTRWYVQLRWSPRCKTNWGRVLRSSWTDGDSIKAIQPSTGYTVGYAARNSSYVWSKMIYSPSRCVYASWNGAHGGATTACI